MAHTRKYAHLLDIDDAPDVYESPELEDADGATKSVRDSEAEEDENGTTDAISRSRLQPDQARDRFDTARVDASKADFSDRVDTKKQAYAVSTRRKAKNNGTLSNGVTEEEHSSEDEGDEGLARRIARLTREIEEVKVAIRQRRTSDVEEGTKTPTESTSDEGNIASLTKALATVHESQRQAVSAHARLLKQLAAPIPQRSSSSATSVSAPPAALPASSEPVDAETLTKLAAFDTRLASLESALGLNAIDMSVSPSASVIPVLPTLNLLDQQISLLASAESVPNIESKTTALRTLTTQSATQPAATNGVSATQPRVDEVSRDGEDGEAQDTTLRSEDATRLKELYALLPTLTSLSPTVQPVLDRLRSLRHLHSAAAGAGRSLDELERRQDEADVEIGRWREGVEKLREVVGAAGEEWKGDVSKVESWVSSLESKMQETNGS